MSESINAFTSESNNTEACKRKDLTLGNRSSYFLPCLAEPWKEWIIEQHLKGLNKVQVHKKLLETFPEASEVSYGSVLTVLKKIKNKSTKVLSQDIKINKSEEIRRLAKEMSEDGLEVKAPNIISVLKNRGIYVTHTHVYVALGVNRASDLNNKISATPVSNSEVKCSIDDVLAAREFVSKIGNIEKALFAINTKCDINDIIAAKEFVAKTGDLEKALSAINMYKSMT